MERGVTTARSDLEHMLVDENAKPMPLPLSLLVDITDGFSHDQQIGRGGFAVVYKGILGDRAVAVKRLTNDLMVETEFHREIECLMRVKHKNIVRFLGYCADRQGNVGMYDGKFVMADVHQRLLCFEYIPRESLDKYIIGAYHEWETCYEIIKGICEGIRYLHEHNIIHLDLKPANILLDDDMIPKITDFGLSRCFDDNQSRHITKKVAGTIGYLAPELTTGHVIARSADLYSLGVIILEILTGHRGCEDIEDVLERWSDKLERSQRHTLCEQIKVCYGIAFECTEYNPKKRPTSARDIVDRLNEMETIQDKFTEGGGASQQEKDLEKDSGGSEQKKNPDMGGGYGEQKNPDRGSKGSEQEKSLDRGTAHDEQEKNPDMGGEQKKIPDRGDGDGSGNGADDDKEQEKNCHKYGGADKVDDKAGSQSQPKEDKLVKKQPPEETKPRMYRPRRSVHNVLGSAPTETSQGEMTVLLRIPMHCNVCAKRIIERTSKFKGVMDVAVDIGKDEVKVVGTMDVASMVGYLKKTLNRPVQVAAVDMHKGKAKGIEVTSAAGAPYGNVAYRPPSYPYIYGQNIGGPPYANPQMYVSDPSYGPARQMHYSCDENPGTCTVMFFISTLERQG